MTVDLRGAAYAASRISSTLKGSTKYFGWLQASATKDVGQEVRMHIDRRQRARFFSLRGMGRQSTRRPLRIRLLLQ
jgi:hypothetical protein